MKGKAVEAIRRAKVSEVSLYLDQDDSGRAVRDYLREKAVTITDKSHLYAGYKDFNDFLVSRPHKHASFSFQQ